MLTPEVQQYINQQRAAGIADAQIRQTLSAQGWQQPDLDQAFGVSSVGPIVPQAPVAMASNNNLVKIIITVLIILVVLPLLFWGAILGYGYWKYKQSGIKITNSGNSVQTSNSKKPLNCDAPELGSTGLGQLSPTLPATWPSDIPVYPESKLLGATSLGVGDAIAFSQVAYCSKDSVDKIVDYFKNSRSGWIFTQSFTESQSSNTVDGKSISLIGKKSGPSGVTIGISSTGNEADTLILEIYGGSASNQPATPVPTGMQIFNESPNFSVQIPTDWKAIQSTPVLTTISAPSEENFKANIIIGQKTVSYSASPRTEAESSKQDGMLIISEGNIVVDGLSAYERVFTWKDPSSRITQRQVIINNQGNLFTITATSLTSLYSKYDPIFKSAINSFKMP